MSDDALFLSKMPFIMRGLINEFGLTKLQSAAILGNIGEECSGFRTMQEVHPVGGGKGGYGWCQWTGSRRDAFELFAKKAGKTTDDDSVNFNFLIYELHNEKKKAIVELRKVDDIKLAVRIFAKIFEAPKKGYEHFESRDRFAQLAFDRYKEADLALAMAVMQSPGLDEISTGNSLMELDAPISPLMDDQTNTAAQQSFANRAVKIAIGEWEFFGEQTYDINNHPTRVGHKEGEENFYQRIAEYWLVGTNTHGIDGRDHDHYWSATFISWVMKEAGAGDKFRYSTQHSVFISQAIRDLKNKRDAAGFWGWRLNERKPQAGDLVCWSRGSGIDYENQHDGNYPAHSDIITEVEKDKIWIIGGNVGNSVTKRPLALSPTGFLSEEKVGGELLFAILENRVDEAS